MKIYVRSGIKIEKKLSGINLNYIIKSMVFIVVNIWVKKSYCFFYNVNSLVLWFEFWLGVILV